MATDEQVAPKKNYGQGGFSGASSDMPGESTSSGFNAGGPTQEDLTQALQQVSPKDGRDTVRDRSGKGNPPAPKDFKQPKFAAPQTREVSAEAYPLSFGMDSRSPRSS
jgi:hypothetical protein